MYYDRSFNQMLRSYVDAIIWKLMESVYIFCHESFYEWSGPSFTVSNLNGLFFTLTNNIRKSDIIIREFLDGGKIEKQMP